MINGRFRLTTAPFVLKIILKVLLQYLGRSSIPRPSFLSLLAIACI